MTIVSSRSMSMMSSVSMSRGGGGALIVSLPPREVASAADGAAGARLHAPAGP